MILAANQQLQLACWTTHNGYLATLTRLMKVHLLMNEY